MYSKDTDQTAYEKISAIFWMEKKNLTWTYVIAFVDREVPDMHNMIKALCLGNPCTL